MSLTRRSLLQAALTSVAVPLLAGMPAPAAAATAVVSDAAFFGVWKATTGTWSTPPVFDYEASAALAPVAAAARAGDYPAARAELLRYMRARPPRTPPAWAYNGVYTPELVPLFLDRIWTLGKGEIYQTTLTVGPDWREVTAEVSGVIQSAVSTGGVGFMLMARNKEAGTAEFASRHAASGVPELTLTYADGTIRTLSASQSCYIAAGSDTATTFGSAATIQVHDEGTGPFGATTRKSYLWFDLTGVTAPQAAQLSLTGRTTGSRQQIMLYQVQVSFDETTRCWNNTVQNTFSWQGDPAGFDWKKPGGANVDNEFGYQLPRFYFAGPLADAYRDEKDEQVAAGLIGLMTDFIADAHASTSSAGAASFPRNLDSAWRYQNWCYAYEILRTSPSLTADANTSILKAIHLGGRYLNNTTSTTPNWMVTIKSALLYLGVCFPEFLLAAQWRDAGQAYLTQQLAGSLYPDGGYTEASSSYAMGVAQTYVGVADVLVANGYQVGAVASLRRLAWYLADQTYPNGYDPAYGDSGYTDQRPALAQLAELIGDDHLRHVATGGAAGAVPDHTSITYPDSRVAVQRTGWKDTDWYLRINADRGNHGHPDELAVQIYAHDRPLLPAMGAYAYVADPTADWLRKSTQSHNTVTIDQRAQDPTADAAISNISLPWADLADGHTDATPGVRHRRTVLFLHDLGWLVCDTLTPADSGQHTYQQNWHLLPDAAPTIKGAMAQTHFAEGSQLTIIPAEPAAVSPALRDGFYSPVTYQVAPTRFVSYSLTASGTVNLDTLLLPVLPGRRTKATLSLEESRDGGRTLRLTASTGKMEGYYFRAPADSTVRRFGTYHFDGSMAYTDDHDGVRRILLTGGTTLRENKHPLLITDEALASTLAVRLNRAEKTIEVTGPAAKADGRPLHVKAPWARTATVAGQPVPIARKGALVTIAALL